MLDSAPPSRQEGHLEALMLKRILEEGRSNSEASKKVARAEARRLHHLAMLIIEHLHAARSLCGALGIADADLMSAVFNLKDSFGYSIASELLQW